MCVRYCAWRSICLQYWTKADLRWDGGPQCDICNSTTHPPRPVTHLGAISGEPRPSPWSGWHTAERPSAPSSRPWWDNSESLPWTLRSRPTRQTVCFLVQQKQLTRRLDRTANGLKCFTSIFTGHIAFDKSNLVQQILVRLLQRVARVQWLHVTHQLVQRLR